MRIISGKFRGKKLIDSSHINGLRPTTDKNREALLNIISSAKFIKKMKLEIAESSILDVCCGSGSVAFEFLSRGAKSAVLIDNNSDHLNLAKRNAKIMDLESNCQFLFCDVKKNLPKYQANFNKNGFDFIFIDPPYQENYLEIINNLKQKEWLQQGSLTIIESDDDQDEIINNCTFLERLELRKYGLTRFGFYTILKSS